MGNCYGSQPTSTVPVNSAYYASTGTTNGSSRVDLSSVGSFDKSGDISYDNSNPSEGSLKAFSFGDLRAATRNFRADGRLGEGGFGVVYKGYLDEHTLMPTRVGQGMMVAIKKLKIDAQQGHREWLAEVHYLGALHHPNLVKLIGFCSEDVNRLLVYEYMARGSLENHLFRRGQQNVLPWAIRVKVAVDAARGLAFLHNAQRQVIYRDFKASNILLDNQFNAKLSDFGLAKDGPMGDDTHVSTRIMGTHGYAAPEYLATGHLSARSDVYSFGVVLLELLTGRRAIDQNRPTGEQKLAEWARPYLNDKRKVMRIVDLRLENQCPPKEAQKVAMLAFQCLCTEGRSRPTMKEVLYSLEALLNPVEAPANRRSNG